MSTLSARLQSGITANSTVYKSTLTERSIRIVKLDPGIGDDVISCSFITVDLKDAIPFNALSYCWGKEPADRAILCEKQEFRITKNLYDALRELRLETEARYMWIDAICINQDSIAEKNQQVQLMGQLYRKASRIIVWLGEEDDTTALALATMQSIFECCCLQLYGAASREDWLSKLENDNDWQVLRTKIFKIVVPDLPEQLEICAKALQTFFKRPWFHRIWVIQEVRGCPHILMQLNETTVAWNAVALTAAWVVYGPDSVTRIREPYKFGGFLHADLMRQRLLTTKDDVPFLEVLDRCRSFESSIDKDRIFALLQHTAARLHETDNELGPAGKVVYPLDIENDPNATHLDLKVDYNSTLFEVYRQIVLRSIHQGRSLQVLSHAIEDSIDRVGYPTWMPVWHASGISRHTGPRRTFLYNASKGYDPQFQTFTDPKLLGLRGIVAGTVTEVSTNVHLSDHKWHHAAQIRYATTLQDIREVAKLIVRDCWQPEHNWLQDPMCRTASQAETHFKDFCAFMTERIQNISGPIHISLHGKWCDICMKRHIASPASNTDEILQILHCETCFDFDMCISCHKSGNNCPGHHTLSPRPIPSMICQLDEEMKALLEAEKGDGNSDRFDAGVRQSFDGKSFVKLDNGSFGIGSETAQPNDLVVVFFGGRVPFILRQHDGHHTIVGECYIHGLMDGEAIDERREGRFREDAFILT